MTPGGKLCQLVAISHTNTHLSFLHSVCGLCFSRSLLEVLNPISILKGRNRMYCRVGLGITNIQRGPTNPGGP